MMTCTGCLFGSELSANCVHSCTLHKCLYQTALTYISELCVPVSSILCLQHQESYIIIPAMNRMISFAVFGPTWYNLQSSLRASTLTLIQFQNRLKNHLFVAYSQHVVPALQLLCRLLEWHTTNEHTYLLTPVNF